MEIIRRKKILRCHCCEAQLLSAFTCIHALNVAMQHAANESYWVWKHIFQFFYIVALDNLHQPIPLCPRTVSMTSLHVRGSDIWNSILFWTLYQIWIRFFNQFTACEPRFTVQNWCKKNNNVKNVSYTNRTHIATVYPMRGNLIERPDAFDVPFIFNIPFEENGPITSKTNFFSTEWFIHTSLFRELISFRFITFNSKSSKIVFDQCLHGSIVKEEIRIFSIVTSTPFGRIDCVYKFSQSDAAI